MFLNAETIDARAPDHRETQAAGGQAASTKLHPIEGRHPEDSRKSQESHGCGQTKLRSVFLELRQNASEAERFEALAMEFEERDIASIAMAGYLAIRKIQLESRDASCL